MTFENAMHKMLQADPNLETSMTIHQGTEKMFGLDCKLYNKKESWKYGLNYY